MSDGSSTLVEEILSKFLEQVDKDDEVPSHIVDLLKEHFQNKPTITPAEIKAILSAPEDVQ